MLAVILVVLVIAALTSAPVWGHSRSWGYYPSGVLGALLLILLILLLADVLWWDWPASRYSPAERW